VFEGHRSHECLLRCQNLHLYVGLGEEEPSRDRPLERARGRDPFQQTLAVTIKAEPEVGVARDVEGAQVIGEAQDGQDAVTFCAE
jgi:hypothetical protein